MRSRRLTAELMDEPGLDPVRHEQALRGLSRLNALSLASRPVRVAALELLGRANLPPQRASILDIATGGGDLLLALVRSGIASRPDARRVGVDVSRTALRIAGQRAVRRGVKVEWLCTDILAGPLPIQDRSFDIVVCSLFLHHLERGAAIGVLAEMARVARCGVVVSDLRRTRVGLALAGIASRALSRSPIVHADSVKSVRAAWNVAEMADLALHAGLAGARVHRTAPQRLLLTWECAGAPR